MFSLVARRSATMMARPRIGAALSTQAAVQVNALEDLLTNMHLAHIKGNVDEICHLLNEPKTNLSLPKDPALGNQVTTELQAVQDMIVNSNGAPDVSGIEARVFGLKKHVRSQLYNNAANSA